MKILIAIPAYNEEKIIRENVLKLFNFLDQNLGGYDYKVIIADNNSGDQTGSIVKDLEKNIEKLEYFYLSQKGKGLAVMRAWQKFQAEFDIFVFMDADLSTNLKALPFLIEAINQGYDIAVGSRYLKGSETDRSLGRKFFSFGYRLALKIMLGMKTKDLSCGFKACNQKVIKEILPQIENQTWFFDTEMVWLAEKKGYKIKEVPVHWREPRGHEDKTRVNLLGVSWLYLKEIWRLKKRKA
ncbi:MAG TPA: glycosyltransferase [Candidatus Uhrbacteria bacterium]|mgnify:CR=1 FL=1|nr:glycosyltransferase [Candidatus Uhrbacteria bacterium]